MSFNIVGSINKSVVKDFVQYCEEHTGGTIFITLCSQGGHAYCARAIAGIIHAIKAAGRRVEVLGVGDINSAAVLILAAGSVRKLSKYASVMVHNDSGSVEGNTREIMEYALQMEADDLAWCKAMADFTGTHVDKWIELHDDGDKHLTPAECLALNLATEIV